MTLRSEVSDLTLTLTQPQAAPLLLKPENVTAQEGDDVILSIPLASDSGEPTSIIWTRGDDQLVGERFSSSTQRGAVNLTVRNATVEDAGRYSLTTQNEAGQAHSDLLLEVRTRPGDVPVFLRRLNDLAVKVGTRTRFLVEVRSPTQVKVSWEQEGKPVLEGERFHLLHEGSFFCVDVAPVTLEDAGIWICRAHNSNGVSKCFCHLNVLVPKAYKAPQFVEELVALLTQQGTVSLECKVVGVPTPTLKWFKDNQEIKAGDVFALSANPQDATSLGTYTCEATNCMGKAYSTSRVHVVGKEGSVQPADSIVPRGPPPVFCKELRNEKAKIGGKLTLECKVTVPPWPKSITWFNKGGLVEGGEGSRYHLTADGLGSYSVEVDQIEAVDDGDWKCVATSDNGVKGISSCTVTVSYPKNYKKPKFLESLKAILTEEGLVSFECKVVGYPTPQLRWFKDGQELKPGDVYQLTGTNSLGSYCCIAKNCMGETSSTAELTVEDIQSQLNEEERLQLFSTNQPPRFLQGLKSIEAKITDPLRFTVQVSVSPQPTVAWYRDDEEVQESEKYKKEQETKGICHLVIKRLELVDQAEWRCVATNDYGQSVTSCFLKLAVPRHYKKPRFLENLRAVLSEEGAVNLECKVIGVPQPTLKWYKDGRELKPGDIHRIISGQDGTCCLGTYTCEASNCMGSVSSSASLLGFEDRGQVKPPEPLRPLPPPAAHLVRQTSLSTIQEERTSQMHDTTLDERAEVSFSFDGKEVSVSLYETPDLTEEEALQVVEMYAEELSEHISGLQEVKSLEHNVVELPPMRFVKETSTSGHLLMEAVVIDVSPEYYASAEDRTEADLDEFSITEDNNGYMSPMVITPDEMPFEKLSADFLERTIQPISSTQQSVPIKPPRKRVADASESSYHSFKEAKVSPEEDSSEQFVDALSSHRDKSQKDSLTSVKSSSGDKQKAVIDVEPTALKSSDINTKELRASLGENNGKLSEGKKIRKKSRSRSKSTEKQPDAISEDNSTVLKDPNLEKKSLKRQLKKRKSTDSEKEDDSLREFEKRKTLKSGFEQEDLPRQAQIKGAVKKNKSSESEKEDDSLQEFESRKSLQKSEKVSETNKTKGYHIKPASDSSGREDDSLIEYEKRKISSDVLSDKVTQKSERQKIPFSKSISTDSSEKDDVFAIKSETSEQVNLRKKRKKSVKKSGSIEKKDQSQKSEIEVPPSSEAESVDREPLKGKKVVSTSDLDRMRSTSDLESIGDKSRAQEEEEHSADFDTAEDSAYDKSEMSVLESLTHSVQEIQKGLMAVGEKIISESSEEPQSAKSSLSIIESLVQPINEIQQGLVKVEKIAEERKAGQYSPSSILETLKEPIQELERNLAVIEQQNILDSKELTLFKRTSQSVLETVSQPLHELHRELAFIQQQAVIETGEETYSEILQSFKPSLLIVQGGVEHTEGEFSSKLDDLTEKTTIPQPTYAQSVVELQTEVHNTDQNLLQNTAVQSESFVPLTVQDIEESLAHSIISQQSLHTIKDSNLRNELQMHSLALEYCTTSLKEKAHHTTDNEIKDILTLTSNLIAPLEQFRTVIERCLLTVVEDDQSIDPQLRAANLALNTALRHSIHAFGSSVKLLEIVANSNSNKEIRGLGIQMLYKLSFPLEELTTTIKLVENLSEHTSVELLTTPVEHLMNASSIIKPELAKTGFAENVSEDGVIIIRELNDTVGSLSNSLRSMTKSLKTYSSLSSLYSLCKPLADLQKTLHKTENKIKMPEKCKNLNSSELYNLAQDLCKPLQAIRTELSLAQHEIELDQYGHLSLMTDPLQEVNPESASAIVLKSLDQVHKSVLSCTEFVLSKSLNESSYLRFVLFALNELILPFNQLNSSIIKTEELVSKDISKLPEPTTGIQAVKSSASDLLAELAELQRHSTTCLSLPETAVIEVLCRMAEPLTQVEGGLNKIIENIHEKDKDSLNINMLKTLAEPFKCLQKSLINISDKLDSQIISHEIFLELKQPIQELQRSILIIQDQVSFEYGDEPATMESNIVTLQSLVQPMNALKKQFLEIDGLLADKTQSSSYSKENKNLHSIIRVNHELQLKISSIMIQENYLNKHSLDSLDMFPIFQELSGLLKDFENALKRVDLICQNESKPDSLFHIKLIESVNSFRSDVINFQNRIVLASNKAIKDVKHPVHCLKKGTETFLSKLSSNVNILMNCKLDESSLSSGYFVFCQNCSTTFVDLLEYLSLMESTWEGELSFKEDMNRDITDISSASFSDTIKDVNTIVDDITETRVSLQSANIPLIHSAALIQVTQELQTFCDSLKTAEEALLENTLDKVNSSISNKKQDKQALVSAFNAMNVQLEKIETYLTDNHDALESISHLKYSLEVVQEHLMFGEEVSEIYILQNLSGPLKTFKDTISKDSPVTTSEIKEPEAVSLCLERFEKSASDLELGLMKLEHALLNSTGDFSSLKNVDIDVLAHPIEELVQYIHNIEEQQNSLHISESVADQSSLTMLKTLALPIKEIQEGVLQIQEQIILESSGNGIPGKSCAGILYEIAKPIRELRSGVALIQEQVVMEANMELLSEDTKASSLKTLAVPVEELKKVLSSIIEQQTLLIEPDLQSLSENISILKTIAVPAKELQNKLASIEVNQIMEGNVESFSAKENLVMLAKPIHILQESIALVENQLALETLGDDLSVKTNISLLKMVAKPLQEVAKHIAIITEQQFVEDVNSEDNTLSDFSTLANVTDISMVSAVLNINENLVLEQGVSFKADFPDLNMAEAVRGNQLNIAVIEEQQALTDVENTSESNLRIRLENIDHGNLASVNEKEVCSPVVAIQQTVSQVETFSVNESKTLQLAEVQDVSCNFAVQAETQEVLIPAGNLTIEKPQFESGIKQDSSLKMAVQVETQEALLHDKSLTCDDSVQVKNVEMEFEPAFVCQGELQQSLADVESLETEEETLKSISIEESSFMIEPQVNIQQVLSDAESFILTDKTSHVAEVKKDIQTGFQNEIQQILSTEENLKTFKKSSDLASVVETTPIIALEAHIQQAMSNVVDLKSKENVYSQANTQETLLEGAVQAECQQVLSNIDSLTSDSGIARHSQAVTMEEGFWELPVQSQILEFMSVAGVIQDIKEELKAKIENEPFYGKAVQQEVQELLTAAESIQSIKEALQVVCVEEPALHTATQSKVQDILSTHEGVQNLKKILDGKRVEELKKCESLNVELQQIISTAQSLDNLRQAISLNNARTEPHQVLSPNDISKTEILQEPLYRPNETVTEATPQFAEETEVQELISLTSNIKTTTEALKAKISTEPTLKCIAQKEFQQIFNIAEEIQSINEALQVASVEKQTVDVATEIEIQQIVTACESLKTIEETIKVQSGKELDIKTAIQNELQQILCSADAVQSVKKALASQTYVETLNEKVVVLSQVCPSNTSLQNVEVSQENVIKEQVDAKYTLELKHDISLKEHSVDENVTSMIEEDLKKSSEFAKVQETVSSDTSSSTEHASEKGMCSDVPLIIKKEEATFISQQIDNTSVEVCKSTTEPQLVIEEALTSTDRKDSLEILPLSDKDNTLTSIPLIGEECFTEESKVLEVQETLVDDASSKSSENTLIKVETLEVTSTDKSSITQKAEINTLKEEQSVIPETVKDIKSGIVKAVSSEKSTEPELTLSLADEVGTPTRIPLLAEEALTNISDISSKSTEKYLKKVEHSDLASIDINDKSKPIIQKEDVYTSKEDHSIIPGIVHDTKSGIGELDPSAQRKELGSVLMVTDELCTTTSAPLIPEKDLLEISEVLKVQETVISDTSIISTEKDLTKSELSNVGKDELSDETKPHSIVKDCISLKDSTKLEKLQSSSDNNHTHNKDLTDRKPSTEMAKTTTVQDTSNTDTKSESIEKSSQKDQRSDVAFMDKKHDNNNEDIFTSKDGENLIKSVKESQLGTQESVTSKDSKTFVHSLSSSDRDFSSLTSSQVQIETQVVSDDSVALISETKAVTNLQNQFHIDVQEAQALDFEKKTEQELSILSDFTDVPSSESITHSQKQDLDSTEKSKCSKEGLEEKVTLSDSIKHAVQIETQQTFDTNETTALKKGSLPKGDHSQTVYVGKSPLAIAYYNDVQEVLSAVDYLDVATETLKSLIVQESHLTVALESEIQQFLLTTENLMTFKENLQAKVVDEPLLLASVNTEFQQILSAVESLKGVKETMQAKCALEPNLPVAQNALPQILLTTQQLEHICETIEAKMSQVQITEIAAQTEIQELLGSVQNLEKGEVKEVTSMLTSSPNLKIAAQVELQQSLFSTKEVQHAMDNAKASCTHAPCIQICAKKSGVASFTPDSKTITKEEETVVEKVVLDRTVKGTSDIKDLKNVEENTTSINLKISETNFMKEEDKTPEKVEDTHKIKITEEHKPEESVIKTSNQLNTSDQTMVLTSKESEIEDQNQATVPKVVEKNDLKETSWTSDKYQENAKGKPADDIKTAEYITESKFEKNIIIDKVPIESIAQVVSNKEISYGSEENIKHIDIEKDKDFGSEFKPVGLNNTTEIKVEPSLIEINRSKLNEEVRTIQDISKTNETQEVKSKYIDENMKTNDATENKHSDNIKRTESSHPQPPKEIHIAYKSPVNEFEKKDNKIEQEIPPVPITQTVDVALDLEKENKVEMDFVKEPIKLEQENKETKKVSKKKKSTNLQDRSKPKEEIAMENIMKENQVTDSEISKLVEDCNVSTKSGTGKEESTIIEEERTYQDSKVKSNTHINILKDNCSLDTANQEEILEITSVIKDTTEDSEKIKTSNKLEKVKQTINEKETKIKDESLITETIENIIKESETIKTGENLKESDIERKDVSVNIKYEDVLKDTEESIKIKNTDETKIVDVDVSIKSIHNREKITKTESSKELQSLNTDLHETPKTIEKNVEHREQTKYEMEKGVKEQNELKKLELGTQGCLTPTEIHNDKHIEKESVTQVESEKLTQLKMEELNKESTQPTIEADIELRSSEKPKYEVKATSDRKKSKDSTALTKTKDNTEEVEDIKKMKSVKQKKKSKDAVSVFKDEEKPDHKSANVCDTLEVKTSKQPEVSEVTTKSEISESVKDKNEDIHGKKNDVKKVETSKETQKRKESIKKQKSEVKETEDKIKLLDVTDSEKIIENVNVEQSFNTNKYPDIHVSEKPKDISTIEGEVSDINNKYKEEYSSLKNMKDNVEVHQKTKTPERTGIPDKVKHMKGGKSIKANEEKSQDTNSKLSGDTFVSDVKRDDSDPIKKKYNNVEDQNVTIRRSKISVPSPKGEEKEKEYIQSSDKIQTKQRLFVDESSTSDYSSESYSESFKIKKSQSYDTRQWMYESESKKEESEGSQLVITKKLTEKKYETPSTILHEKSSYQRQRRQTTSKPVFCGRLVDRTAAQGSKLKVTCSLTGSPEPTVQWYKDGHLISAVQDPRLHMRLSNGLASLEITEATLGDSGKYTCVARNASGETSTTSTIKIFSYIESAPEAPVFTQAVKDQYKSSSDELVIECRVKGHPLPSVTWLKDSQPLRIASRYQQSVLTDGTCRLVIHGPEPSDSGLYKCVAENLVWSEQTSGFVMFEGREKHLAASRNLTDTKVPRFTNILSDHVVREGGTVALQVAIKGTPKAEVTWYRNSEPLPKKSSRFRYLEDGGVYSLVMSDASITEAGTYTCRASNMHGYRDTSVNVQIVGGARGKPAMFVSRPDTSMNIAVGEDITISFRVTGDPKPRVTWMKNMKDITNNIRTLKETVNDYVRLSLKHATIMDSGTYFITAKNIYGTDHAFVTVRVRQRARSLTPTRSIWSGPDTSTLLRDIHESTRALVNDVPGPVASEATVSDSGKNWVSLTWGKPENRGAAPVLAYRVEAWLLGSEGGAHWNELGVTPINSFDAFFLKPGSEYKFRITARNRYGWGESVTSTESVTIGSASNYPPDILRDLPGPLKALQGDNITLECEVGGDPPPYVQWLRDGQDVGTIAALQGRVFVSDSQLTHRLIVKQLIEDDSGRYVCEAVNKLGRASTYARLLVVSDPRLLEADRKLKENLVENQESAPQVTMRLRDRRVQATYPVRLSCQVVGNPTPTVSWAHQGNPISPDDRHQLVAEADHFYTLEICRTVLEDGGQYTVTAQNCLGAVSCHCQLTVDKGIRAYVAPDYTSELESTVSVREGSDLHIFAQVEAYPTVGIAWHRDGVRLRPSRRLVMTVDCEGRLQLSLAGITAREAGLYCCTATNAVGRAQTSCQVIVTSGTTPITANLPAILAPSVPYSKEPRFVTKPRSSEAVEGETVVINCEVVGDPQPDVMWLRDWLKPGYYRDAPQFRQVAGGCQYSLEIPQVKLDFTGTYCVIASNPHGEAKAIISLQIYAKGQGKESSMVSGQVKHGKVETLPEIKRELKDLRCCDGDSATLECLVLATPPPAVRWEKDGKLLPLGEDIEAAVDGEVARLTIKKVYPEDEGQYSCVAYNELGRAVTTACLVVDVPEEKETLLSQQLSRPPGLLSARSTPHSTPRNTPSPARSVSPLPSRYREFSSPSYSRPKRLKMSSPKFYTVPHNRIAEEGETVRFQCAVAGHPTPWASWDKDGHIVTPSARLSVTERDDLRTLELREVTVEDAGLYRVTLENEMGSVEATARLDVIGRQGSRTRSVRAWSAMRASPTFGRRLVGSAARVGGTFTLTCDVHASPSPITSWYRNGEMLVMSDRVVPSWDGRRARLELRGLQQEDAGVYTCVAENAVGTTQCSAELRVLQTTDPSDADLQPPVFLQGLLPELTVVEGQPVELETRLQGSTPMEVVWVKDGVEVPDCEDFRHVDYGDGRYGLRIADLFLADGGIYNCEAFNDHGDAITSGHLIVTDPAGMKSVRSQEPEICFTKKPSPVIARLRGPATFCARLQGNSLSLSHASFTWTVGGRTVSSTDHRCQVTTEEDCSVLHISEVCAGDAGPVTCTARVCSPGVPPTTVSCDTHLGLDCAPGSPATLLRGPSDTTAMRGDRVLLKATYRGSPEPHVRWLKAGRELRTEGRVQIVSRDGVSCLTVSAITADDSGKYVVSVENIHGADCHFASVAVEGPPEPPAARPSVSRGPDCATVAWSSPAYDGGCVLTGYRVEMRTTDSQDWSVVADRCHSLSHVVRGLTPGQSYVFRVRAENIHGASDSSAESFPFTLDSPDRRDEELEPEGEGEEGTLMQVSLEPGEQFLQRYSVHEELGKGRYGVVHKVTDLRTQHTMAAKFVRCIKKQDREKVQEEIDIMNCLRHSKLLQLVAAFENPKDIIMIMEYISGGELFERVVADDFTLTERDCILFLRQICEGVSYMHQSHVVHLDLKPENIMCHTRTSHRIKIIDFGLAQKLESGTPVRVLFGTPEFIPPEIINYEPIGVESDMWSVGVICYVLLSGLSPFMGDNDAETFANITRADYDFDDEAFDAISQDAKDFISALLIKRKEKRLTAEECLQHKWLTQCDMTMSCVKLSTDKLKKFIIRRKWQPRYDRQVA